MTHPSTPRRRWRRTALATAGVSLIAAVSPMIGANPAAAVNAPLVTTNGAGIRIDENAILGPALELIEDELQPFVNTMIYNGAWNNSVMDDPDWVTGTATIELSFDFVNAGVTGYPQGGLKVHADLTNILMRFYRYGEWWQPACLIHVVPDNGYIDASAKVNAALLPSAPLQLNPITAYWDTTPTATVASGYSTLCYGYLIDEWWDGLWGSGADVATQIEDELNGQAQDLVNDLWAQHVTPIINSLNEFGITFNEIRTDDHGLIVTANLNATTGLNLPGFGTFTVADTPDSGITSSITTLLANRGEIIATIHPNVAAQVLNAVHQSLGGSYGSLNLSAAGIESILLNSGDWATYDDTLWYSMFTVSMPPAVTATGTGGAPLISLPQFKLEFFNLGWDFGIPVATYEGSMSGIKLITDDRVAPDPLGWGPAINVATATVSMTRTQANVHSAAKAAATNTQLAPYARDVMVTFNTGIFINILTLAPITIGGLSVALCTTCGRYTGDQRYTETFNVA
ncbi:MAG TPA: hypothetical protein VF228_12655 [Iamia sp.]